MNICTDLPPRIAQVPVTNMLTPEQVEEKASHLLNLKILSYSPRLEVNIFYVLYYELVEIHYFNQAIGVMTYQQLAQAGKVPKKTAGTRAA